LRRRPVIAKILLAPIAEPDAQYLRYLLPLRFAQQLIELYGLFALAPARTVIVRIPKTAGHANTAAGFLYKGFAGKRSGGLSFFRRHRRCVAGTQGTRLVLGSRRSLGIYIGGLTLHLLALGFLGQFAFETLPLSGLEEEGVLLHILDDAFLLNLPLESPKSALDGFAIEHPNCCQIMPP